MKLHRCRAEVENSSNQRNEQSSISLVQTSLISLAHGPRSRRRQLELSLTPLRSDGATDSNCVRLVNRGRSVHLLGSVLMALQGAPQPNERTHRCFPPAKAVSNLPASMTAGQRTSPKSCQGSPISDSFARHRGDSCPCSDTFGPGSHKTSACRLPVATLFRMLQYR